jgi:tRNA(Ile)-lysidine synthase TilS/MesJ
MTDIDARITDLARPVASCITDYQLPLAGPIVVGLSGGKDSFFLSLALRHLGYEVRAAIVDLGYANFSAHTIQETATLLGIRSEILRPHPGDLSKPTLRTLLNVLQTSSGPPCGACSSAKKILLTEYAEATHATAIALGHHRDDFIVTLLKDYFIELYYPSFGTYAPHSFACFLRSATIDEPSIGAMVKHGTASTMSLCAPSGRHLSVVRPLAYVRESEIRRFTTMAQIRTSSSGCSHDSFAVTLQPPAMFGACQALRF